MFRKWLKTPKQIEALGDRVPTKSSLVIDEDFERIVNDIAPTTDDPNQPSLTLRVWVLGTLFCITLGAINTIFSFRTNSFEVSAYVATLLSYPLGVFLAKYVPRHQFSILGLAEVDTNPGPFSMKEHVLIGIFGTTGASGVYAVNNLVVQEVYYEMRMHPVWSLLFLFSSSALGFGLSGMCRKLLIRPAHMIWPTVLPTVALYTAFHSNSSSNIDPHKEPEHDPQKQPTSKLKYFAWGVLGMGIFHLIGPGYLMPMLSNLPFLCWIFPSTNLTAQRLGSPVWGPGLFAWTTDWTVISSTAMSMPYWSAVNVFLAAVLFHWILTPLAWKNNWFQQPTSPYELNSTRLWTNQSQPFDVANVIDKQTHILNVAEYQNRAPIHMSPFFLTTYFANFATLPAALMHTIVWYGKDIIKQFRMSQEEEDKDVHCRLIDHYPEVSNARYYMFFAAVGVMLLITGQFSELQFPWWASIFAIVLSFLCTIPIAVVLATAGVTLYMNVISQFLIGLILPGQPILVMAFKALGVSVSSQCLTLLTDLKIGHYLKVPPRHVFIAQVSSQLMSAFVCYITMRFWLNSDEHIQWIKNDGKVEGTGQKWGASTSHNIYYSASLIWGAIGPKRFFFDSPTYAPVIWLAVIIGITTPFVLRLAYKLTGSEIIKLIHPAIILGPNGAGGNQGTTLSTFTVATFFQFYMYRYQQSWWKRYNYILATAFDVGVALVALIMLVLPAPPNWFLACVNGDCGEISDLHGPYQDWCHPI